jgi:uncharacterized YigZ family protein
MLKAFMQKPYFIPSESVTIETEVSRSRFIATVHYVESVESARSLLAKRRIDMLDANHHVYAFRIGHGSSVIEGLSDDGEPSGTSGPPIMAVLRGTSLGDTLVIVTRYFGGTKLGTGGLVRAYSEAAALALQKVPRVLKIEKARATALLPYSSYTVIKRILAEFHVEIRQENFSDSVEVEIEIIADRLDDLYLRLRDITSGDLVFERLP